MRSLASLREQTEYPEGAADVAALPNVQWWRANVQVCNAGHVGTEETSCKHNTYIISPSPSVTSNSFQDDCFLNNPDADNNLFICSVG